MTGFYLAFNENQRTERLKQEGEGIREREEEIKKQRKDITELEMNNVH